MAPFEPKWAQMGPNGPNGPKWAQWAQMGPNGTLVPLGALRASQETRAGRRPFEPSTRRGGGGEKNAPGGFPPWVCAGLPY